MLVPIITPDIDVDIENELSNQEHVHAFAMCSKHQDLRPESGRIVQSLCGALVRIQWNNNLEECPKCRELFSIPKSGKCWVCGVPA